MLCFGAWPKLRAWSAVVLLTLQLDFATEMGRVVVRGKANMGPGVVVETAEL
jgi:hypothetical protein